MFTCFRQLILFTTLLATEMDGVLLSEMFLLATDGEWDHFDHDCLKEPPFRRERELHSKEAEMTIIGIVERYR